MRKAGQRRWKSPVKVWFMWRPNLALTISLNLSPLKPKALVYKLHITVCSNWRQRNEAFISHGLRATAEGCRLPGPSSCMWTVSAIPVAREQFFKRIFDTNWRKEDSILLMRGSRRILRHFGQGTNNWWKDYENYSYRAKKPKEWNCVVLTLGLRKCLLPLWMVSLLSIC